jgi:hypothetical protein
MMPFDFVKTTLLLGVLINLVTAYVHPFLNLDGFSWAENLLITNDGIHMFVSEYTRGELHRVSLATDGKSYLQFVHLTNTSFTAFAGLAQSTDGSMLYAGVAFIDGSVGIVSTSTSASNNGAFTIVKKTTEQPNGLVFDEVGNKLYYTEISSNSLFSVDILSFEETVVANVEGANGLWLDAERLLYAGELLNKNVNVFDLKTAPPAAQLLGRYAGISTTRGLSHALDDLTVYRKDSTDPSQTVLVGADISAQKIQKFSLDGETIDQVMVSEAVLATGEVQSPTSSRWGKLPNFDPDSIYMAEGGGMSAGNVHTCNG